MHVIGTAGHVDHGKSTLVEALTGIDPDRLKEEKEREMTIDLGFAWFKPGENREEIGIVDVPGHRDFIENMLAGVGGIDLAILVIAADEGVMPQTKEHLAILDLLKIQVGIVALTKLDLVDDVDWLELVLLDIEETVQGTVFDNAPVIQISAVTGEGLPELRQEIDNQLKLVDPHPDNERPRLSIDRVFTLSGFGTVVTGTLLDGIVKIGDTLELQPSGDKVRVRGLQTHQTKLQIAQPGSRVAVNLTGLGKDNIRRGHVLTAPGTLGSTILCDVTYTHLSASKQPLKHNEEVKFFTGSAEIIARTRLLGARQIDPGKSGWLQLVLREPVAIARKDKFILRRPSPSATIGGGMILDPHPGRRHKRFRPDVIIRLELLASGTSSELLLDTLERKGPLSHQQLFSISGLDEATARQAWEELINADKILTVGAFVIAKRYWQKLDERMVRILRDFHSNNPLRIGMQREELRSRIEIPASIYNVLLSDAIDEKQIVDTGRQVRLYDHEIVFNSSQKDEVEHLLQEFLEAGISSPSVKDVRAQVGTDVYSALLDLGEIVQISDEVVYTTSYYQEIVAEIREYLKDRGTVDAAQIRDLLSTSRKYAIAILEHLDELHVTKRVGDSRVLLE